MARRTQTVRRRRSNKTWGGAVQLGATITAASTKLAMGNFAQDNPGIDETALRWVGILSVATDQSAASEDQQGAFGIIRVSATAITLGVTALPSPLTNISDDWIVHIPFLQRFVPLSAVGFDPHFVTQYKFDFKTKRILGNGQGFAFVLESSANSEGFEANLILRVLSMVTGT